MRRPQASGLSKKKSHRLRLHAANNQVMVELRSLFRFLKHSEKPVYMCEQRESQSRRHEISVPDNSYQKFLNSKLKDSSPIKHTQNTNQCSFWWGYADTHLHFQILGFEKGYPSGNICIFADVYMAVHNRVIVNILVLNASKHSYCFWRGYHNTLISVLHQRFVAREQNMCVRKAA